MRRMLCAVGNACSASSSLAYERISTPFPQLCATIAQVMPLISPLTRPMRCFCALCHSFVTRAAAPVATVARNATGHANAITSAAHPPPINVDCVAAKRPPDAGPVAETPNTAPMLLIQSVFQWNKLTRAPSS
eukprot:7390958-Prymnesium_polylepis.3